LDLVSGLRSVGPVVVCCPGDFLNERHALPGDQAVPLTNAVQQYRPSKRVVNGSAVIGIIPLLPERVFNGIIDEVRCSNGRSRWTKSTHSTTSGAALFSGAAGVCWDPPSSQVLYAGRVARFRQTATGSLPLVYRWLKNGTNINDGGNISGVLTDTLTISNITRRMPARTR